MPALPVLKPWFSISYAADRAIAHHGARVVELTGQAALQLLPHLLPLLDGTRTVPEIIGVLMPSDASPDEQAVLADAVRGALGQLDRLDLLRAAAEPSGAEADVSAGFRDAMAPWLTHDEIAGPPARRSVVIRGPQALAEPIADACRGSGVADVEVADAPADGPVLLAPDQLTIAVPHRDRPDLLARVNDAAVRQRRPWLQVLPFDGVQAIVGPLYLGGRTACYHCFVVRMDRAGGTPGLHGVGEARFDYPFLGSTDAVIAGLAAHMVATWAHLGDAAAQWQPARFHLFDVAPTFRLTYHHLLRVPRCGVCGTGVERPRLSPWRSA